MKQAVNRNQLEELSKKAYSKLDKWMSSKGYWTSTMVVYGPMLGQMMEFLGDAKLNWLFDGTTIVTETLCDELWEAVKEVLEK